MYGHVKAQGTSGTLKGCNVAAHAERDKKNGRGWMKVKLGRIYHDLQQQKKVGVGVGATL